MKGLIPAARAALSRARGLRMALRQRGDRFKRFRQGHSHSRQGQLATILLITVTLMVTFGCAQVAMAAGSCTYSSVTLGSNNIDSVRYYRYVCTAAADNSLSATMDVTPMQGRTCTKFVTTPLVAPTDSSDLNLAANGITYIAAAGKGANAIDATTVVWDYFEGNLAADGTLDGYWEPVEGKNATVDMTNNSVTLASFYLDFICY